MNHGWNLARVMAFFVFGLECAGAEFRAGAAVVDVSPTNFPVIVNAMFTERSATKVVDPLVARALVLDDGTNRIAITVVDTCMMPRDLIDKAKRVASQETRIPVEKMLVSATHTHSAPAAMGCLGSRADTNYAASLPGRIAEAIVAANGRLQRAQIGFTSVDDWDHTFNRRWIRRPDRIMNDPFGNPTVRAHMHPGHQSPDAIGPSGPVDPGLSILAVQTADGRPLALLANYSQHYYDSPLLSSDYYGKFALEIARLLGAPAEFVGIMSQGTSGDLMWMDYGAARRDIGYAAYAREIAERVKSAYAGIKFEGWVPLAIAERKLAVKYRAPDAKRLEWARGVAEKLGGRLPQSLPEIYALEAIYLHERPETELVLQALRIGDVGITASPNEVYAITGLKLKAWSPIEKTFNIELANGAEGYIPPVEQHKLGGYTTWPARTAGLEVQAEARIVASLVSLLEEVSGKPRRSAAAPRGPAAEAVLKSSPDSFWRFEEMIVPTAGDSSGRSNHAVIEDGVALYLPGPGGGAGVFPQAALLPSKFSGDKEINRAFHFAGGRVRAKSQIAGAYSVEFWFWNGLPNDARAVTGYLFSLGAEGDPEAAGDHLGIGGTHAAAGKLIFFNGNKRNELLSGKRTIPLREWHHVALIREGENVAVYLDGEIEISGRVQSTVPAGAEMFIGGRNDRFAGLEGKIDEVAVFARALKPEEARAHFGAAELPALPAAKNVPLASKPLSPEESMKKIHVTPGFRVELAASEPAVIDPVAIDWDSLGRLWAVEMADYPMGMDGKGKPGGRVRVLEDADGDGRFEKGTVFADGLNFPTGLITWRDGVIVTAAPEILFLRDTNDDGKADERRVLFSGFLEGNQQLRINGLRWGLDNWIYCAVGGHYRGYGAATKIKSTITGKEIALGSRDFRFRPDTGEFEPQSGPSQFGRNRDDWGHWFGTQNSNPLFHYVLEDYYLRRNPHVPTIDPVSQVFRPVNPKVYPRSPQEKRFHSFEQAGHFTSACSGMIYQDDLLFGAGTRLQAFACEPFHSVAQRQEVIDDGATFRAQRAKDEQASDFFASEDGWCRPVMTRTGPDGALWIVDMYRYMIEHPDWLPPEGREELLPHYREGDDKGRIYRVLPVKEKAREWPKVARLPSAGLARLLESPNGWLRDKAQMELLWRGERSVTNALLQLDKTPAARTHALWTLDAFESLPEWLIAARLRDEHPGVRENALRLAEKRGAPTLVAAALALVDDPSPKVRLQLACALGEWTSPAAGQALGKLAAGNSDPYIVAAVLSSAVPHLDALARALLADRSRAGAYEEGVEMMLISLKRRDLLAEWIAPIFARSRIEREGHFVGENMFLAVADFLRRLNRQRVSLADLARGEDALARTLADAPSLFAAAAEWVNGKTDAPGMFAAASLLAQSPAHAKLGREKLAGLVAPRFEMDLQKRAIRALADTGNEDVPVRLLDRWPEHGPEVRGSIIEALLRREPWTIDLLGAASAGDFDVARRARLRNHASKRVRDLAGNMFGAERKSSRAEVIESFTPALKLPGDVERGRTLFNKACASCHKKLGEGNEVGPDLQSVTEHSPEKLLANILDPSADIQPGFQAYTVQLQRGDEVYGAITAEAGSSVIMKLPDGSARTILRGEISSIRSSNLSLMPEGLEAGMTHQDMADLIAFLRKK